MQLRNVSEGSSYAFRRNQDRLFKQELDTIAEYPRYSQREVASTTGFSLGLVNLILKRLIETGHIKVSNLNKRKMEYLLTRKGLMEKAARSYAYLKDTVRVFSEYRRRLNQLMIELKQKNHKRFAVSGDGELVSLVENALKSMGPDVQYRHVAPGEAPRTGEILLDCSLDGCSGSVGISVLNQLLNESPLAAKRVGFVMPLLDEGRE